MGLIPNIPYRPAGGDVRSIAGILSDFDTILAEFNGNIDNANVKASAGISWSKMAALATGQIVAGNGGVPTARTLSGDATIDASGNLILSANSVGQAEIADNSVGQGEMLDDAVGEEEITAALAQKLGVSEITTVRRGKSIIATEESRTNTAYGTLTTPDQVANVVLPTDGLIFVTYQALWKSSVAGAAKAAIFIGATQLKAGGSGLAAPVIRETSNGGNVNNYQPLHSIPLGLKGDGTNNPASGSDVTTGQVIGDNTTEAGGVCSIFAAAGTYTVSVQFKATSGSVTAKERKLWVWTMGF